MDSSTPIRIQDLRGKVTQGEYGKGSKSERTAIFLEPEDGGGPYVLRRKGGPVFGDPKLEKLAGTAVICDGFLLGTTFLAESIRPVK
jgi:hypothetical protein